MYSQMEVTPTSDLSNQSEDVLEIGWTDAADTVKSSGCYLEMDLFRHRQPVEDMVKDWSDAVELAGTDDQTDGSIQDHL